MSGNTDPQPFLEKVLELYQGSPFLSRLYLQIRVRNFPIDSMWPVLLGLRGEVFSIGAGYGIFETAAAIANPAANFLATDLNPVRVDSGAAATRTIPNIKFGVVDLSQGVPEKQPDVFLLLDVLHHLSPPVQEMVLTQVAGMLKTGGRIVIKECGTKPVWKRWFNRLNDAIGAPFSSISPRSEQDWAAALNARGFSTAIRRLDRHSPYAHILIEAKKN
jgi:2-polyprenyl-3-methyl-5-hydroxy-6-metoxy-1,4-benzoquinol methylase